MIDNSDRVGDYQVGISGKFSIFARFQCPTFEDAKAEIERVVGERRAKKLPVTRATITRIVADRMVKGRRKLIHGVETVLTF